MMPLCLSDSYKHCESPKCNNDEMTPLFQNSCNTSCHIRAQPVTKNLFFTYKEQEGEGYEYRPAIHDPLILCLKNLNLAVH